MLKKLVNKFIKKFWQKQNKKLKKLQQTVDRLEQELAEQSKQVKAIKKQADMAAKYDYWERKAAEDRWLAKDKKIWVIKCPIPEGENKYLSGEYNFAVSLKKALEKLGYFVVIDMAGDWDRDMKEADVVLVLRIKRDYRPDRRNTKCKYILWHFCHPSLINTESYELYDLVYVNSISYAEKVAKEVSVPVKPLLSCADTNLFFPQDTEDKYDKVFVGNTRKVIRNFVVWCENNNIPLHIWGKMDGADGWKSAICENSPIILESSIRNDDLPEVYRASRIIMNDHFDDMRELGFVNNRMIEALCCGRPLLSDYSEDFEKIFGNSVVFYHDEEDFLEKLKYIEDNYEECRQKVLEMWPKLQEEFSFEARAKYLAEEVLKNP